MLLFFTAICSDCFHVLLFFIFLIMWAYLLYYSQNFLVFHLLKLSSTFQSASLFSTNTLDLHHSVSLYVQNISFSHPQEITTVMVERCILTHFRTQTSAYSIIRWYQFRISHLEHLYTLFVVKNNNPQCLAILFLESLSIFVYCFFFSITRTFL